MGQDYNRIRTTRGRFLEPRSANKLGSLGSEAFDIAQKLGRSAGLGAFAGGN